MEGAVIESVEAAFGDRLAERIRRHHRRRLAGWAGRHAFDPPAGRWTGGGTPVRAGNTVDVLIDGAEALPLMAETIRGARPLVHLAGFFFTPGSRSSGTDAGRAAQPARRGCGAVPKCACSRGRVRRCRSSSRRAAR